MYRKLLHQNLTSVGRVFLCLFSEPVSVIIIFFTKRVISFQSNAKIKEPVGDVTLRLPPPFDLSGMEELAYVLPHFDPRRSLGFQPA